MLVLICQLLALFYDVLHGQHLRQALDDPGSDQSTLSSQLINRFWQLLNRNGCGRVWQVEAAAAFHESAGAEETRILHELASARSATT